MQLPDAWYVVAASEEIGNKPLSVVIFSKEFVLWRDESGKVVMQNDSCPHRSAKLSLGEVHKNCIQCPFHGFTFDTSGNCTFVPETEKPSLNLKVETHEVVERNGFIWLKKGSALPESAPWFHELGEDLSMYQSIHEWPTHLTRCVENQLDYAHLPFVHRKTIGRNVDVTGIRRIDCQNDRISMYVDEHNKEIPTIQFIFPNLWLLTISAERFFQFIAFVPVSPERTRLYLRAYQSFARFPLIEPVLKLIFNKSNSMILNEDRAVVLSQTPIVSTEAGNEKLFQSDRAIEHFRRLWRETTTLK